MDVLILFTEVMLPDEPSLVHIDAPVVLDVNPDIAVSLVRTQLLLLEEDKRTGIIQDYVCHPKVYRIGMN